MSCLISYDASLDKLLEDGHSLQDIDKMMGWMPGTAKAEMVYDWKLDKAKYFQSQLKYSRRKARRSA